ncbi:MAG: hypothetical protein EXR21_07505 [Flavobacteriaceae bacterium]|nr:hypothetical protein [Flavobacteriaceae bacterium]
MKLVATILSIYFALLTVMPCMDEGCVEKCDYATIENPCIELCQPFCQCDCCGSQSVSQMQVLQVSASVIYTKPLFSFVGHSTFLPRNNSRVWQPPRWV